MNHHLRIAALQCNFQDREHTLGMPEIWHDMGFSAEQLLHTHADMYSAIYDPTVHRNLLVEYLDKSKKQELETIVYMNCHILGPSIAGHYREWGIRNIDGETFPRFYNTYYGCCLSSGWKEYFFNCVRSLCEFDIAGLFFDGPFYTPCGCPVCQKNFENQYHKSYTDGNEAERKEFAFERVIAFKDELYALVKSVNLNWFMYFNEGLFAGRSGRKNMVRQIRSDDIIGTEGGFFFYEPPKQHSWWYCSSCAKTAEAVADGKRTVIFQAGDHKPWGWFMHTPAETKLCYASALFNGAGIWYGIHCNPENLNTIAGQAAREMLHFDRDNQTLWEKSRSLAETAVLYSFDTAAIYPKEGQTSDLYADDARKGSFPGNYTNSFQGALAIMEHLARPYDIVTDLRPEQLKKYKQLILPSLAMADDDVLLAIKEFVQNGGTVIADGEFGRYFGDGEIRELGNSAFSLRFTGKVRNHGCFNYMTVDSRLYTPDNAFGYMPAPQWSLGVEESDVMQIHGHCTEPLAGCYEAKPGQGVIPFLFETDYAKGKFYFFAGGFFESYFIFYHLPYRKLMEKILKKEVFSIENPVNGITLSVRESEAGTFMGLCNYTSPIRPIEKPAVIQNLCLNVPKKYTSAEDLASHISLKQNKNGYFILPELQEFACILLKQ
ncbi:MAG: beta-galactosidase trimerization domain-containing protein [Victivallaceae bacterium]